MSKNQNSSVAAEPKNPDMELSLLEEILDHIPEGVFATDSDDRIIIYNHDVELTEQMRRGEVMGRPERDVYAYDTHYAFNVVVTERVKKTRRPIYNQDYAQVIPGGKTVHICFDSYPFYYRDQLRAIYTIGQRLDRFNDFIAKTLPFKRQVISESLRAPSRPRYRFENIIGSDPQLKNCLAMAAKVARYNSSVMIIGETGTGKELLAQSIHNASGYAHGPFLAINCAAVPENLLEGILFGTSTGAFSEAVDLPGLFEQAQGGTVFLDEINSMPETMQAKLLRAVQDKKVRRLGGREDRSIDCRILSATNIDPFQNHEAMVIRADLLFRLAAVSLNIPPLRERRGDILLLSRNFIRALNKEYSLSVKGLSPALEKIFIAYDWPGNVRELRNILESAMCLLESGRSLYLEPEHLPDYFKKSFRGKSAYTSMADKRKILSQSMREYEAKVIQAALERHQGNVSAAARELKIGRSYLHTKIKDLGLRAPKEAGGRK